MISYKDYMENSSKLHQAFYEEVAQAAGISYKNSPDLSKIKDALAKDENLNNIPLHKWDIKARFTQKAISKALKERGTSYSLSSGVCTHKAAARAACEVQS